MSRSTWPIIVGGCHRSGTSLMRRILNAHARICCGPEVKFFRDFYDDYPQDAVRHLRFMGSARAILPEEDRLEILGRAFIRLHQRAAAYAGKPRWADKNPENVLYLQQWQQLLGKSWLMVHVVRNPLDTLASIKEAKFPFSIPLELDGRIAFYQQYTQAGLEFGRAHPDRYYRLLYEQLVDSPEATLRDLMHWLGEEFQQGQLAFNQFPQQKGLEDPKVAATDGVHADSLGRWPEVLSREEAQTVWQETRDIWSGMDPEGRYRPTEQQWKAVCWT